MLDLLRARLRQTTRPAPAGDAGAALPDRFRGRLAIDRAAAPPDRLLPVVDLGASVFAPEEAVGGKVFTRDCRMAARTRDALVADGGEIELAHALDAKMRSLFGR